MFWLWIAGLLVVDQVTKYLVVSSLELGQSYPLIDGVFRLTYVQNDGAAFSILQGQRWFFVVITLIALVMMVFVRYKYYKKDKWMTLALAVLAAGALGNLIDRFLYGYVVDFFDFYLINFAVFNVADCCIVVSLVFITIMVIKKPSKDKNLNA
ncbi:MAG: signal peptidase II [Clostridia bacterium]|nr:signal peptidase II [Clostridia bacterium]